MGWGPGPTEPGPPPNGDRVPLHPCKEDQPLTANPTGPRRQREPFVMVPRSLLYADVAPRLVVLFGVLDDLARNHPAVVVSQTMLARTLSVSRRTIQRWLAELEAAGYLTTDQPGNGALAYRLLSRPRTAVDNYPVDLAQVRQDWRTYAAAGASKLAHLPGPALSIRAREEEQAPFPLAPVDDRAPWCGICDARTRLLEDPDSGQPSRCSRCHPASTATPPF